MQVTHELKDELNGIIKIELSATDYTTNVNNVLRDYRKKANMPGFRPGNVPMGMVKKMYGKAVMAEEINKILLEQLNKYIADEKLEILGNPLPVADDSINFDVNKPGDFNFTYDIGLAPEFDVKLSAKFKFDYNKVAVDEELVDKQISDVTRRYGKVNQVEEAGENDMLSGEFVELDAEGNIKEGGIVNTSTIALEFIEDEATKAELKGKKVDDTFVVDPFKVSKGHDDLGRMLNISHEQVHAIEGAKFNFKVTQIYHMVPADLDQDLFDKVYGEKTVGSEEEFKSKVKEELETAFSKDSDRLLSRDVQNKLMEKFNLVLPDDFLKRWLKAASEQPLTDDQIASEYDAYAKGLRWSLIENKIIKENDVKVEQDEVVAYTKELLKMQFAQYGQANVDDELLSQSAQNVLANQDETRKIYEQLYAEKVIEVYKEKFKLVDKDVTYDEFVKLATGK